MPHCILEYSKNVLDSPDLSKLFLDLHEALVATGEFQRKDLKSRAFAHNVFAVGDGAPERSFVALQIRILEGRTDALKARLSELGLSLLVAAFPRTLASGQCGFSVEIADMHRASYRRQSAPG
jgi:5-carboxymethyl-2-hydroxymuconate isomerase